LAQTSPQKWISPIAKTTLFGFSKEMLIQAIVPDSSLDFPHTCARIGRNTGGISTIFFDQNVRKSASRARLAITKAAPRRS